MPSKSKPWLQVSATECTPSASIVTLPDKPAATNLAMAMPKFPASAAITTFFGSPLPCPAIAGGSVVVTFRDFDGPEALEGVQGSRGQGFERGPEGKSRGDTPTATHDAVMALTPS